MAQQMLLRRFMKSVSLVLAVLGALLIAAPSSAYAGGFVSAGVGTAPSLGGDLDTYFDGDGHRSAKVAVGNRMGPIGIEVGLGGYGLHGVMPVTGAAVDGTALSLSASLTGHVPLFLWLDG